MCAGTACCPLRRIRAAAASLSRSTICWTMRTCSGSPTALRSPSQNRIADEREETMTNDRLPHFVIIGAVKGATTWIHNQLQDNPAIYLPAPEPHFFSQDFDRGPIGRAHV